MEREMLAEAAEHRVIGASIFSGSHYRAGIFLRGHMLTAAIERSDTGYPLRQLIWLWKLAEKAVGPYTLVSPLSQRDCLYYRVVIRVLRKSSSQIIDELCAPLFIDDGTGELMICPKGAEMQFTGSEGDGGNILHMFSPATVYRETI
jgi:hypothetical protein